MKIIKGIVISLTPVFLILFQLESVFASLLTPAPSANFTSPANNASINTGRTDIYLTLTNNNNNSLISHDLKVTLAISSKSDIQNASRSTGDGIEYLDVISSGATGSAYNIQFTTSTDSKSLIFTNVPLLYPGNNYYSCYIVDLTSGGNNDLCGDADSPNILTLNNTSNFTPVYRFWSNEKQKHFYTATTGERDYVDLNYNYNTWYFERVAYLATKINPSTQDCTGMGKSPVYRFWSDKLQGHFYTISAPEKEYVSAHYGDVWKYEKVAFCADLSADASTGNLPVYRFWSDRLQTHFYTINEAEKDYVINNLASTWKYERIAYYAFK